MGVKLLLSDREHFSPDAGQSFEQSNFSMDGLPRFVEEADGKMGLHDAVSGGFSRNNPRIELSGPDMYPSRLLAVYLARSNGSGRALGVPASQNIYTAEE